ncbi:hypothetical protein [Geotalea sp. SG265]|uniref:hypothetical protein n=1 Tax=Geotalea sp. SG265 TaxID=2922867 RepID=UPI001FB024AE|nr:hypothetical protein [Geotalea sp. SG265]
MSRNIFRYSTVIASLLATALFAGCGSSNKEGSASSLANVAKVDEASCRVCHSTSVEPVTGDNILQDYLGSIHNLNTFHKVGCQDCHGGGAQHNGVGPIPYTNPDASGKCFECHQKYLPKAHFAVYTAATHPAQYVSSLYQNSCTSCHDPHKADKGITPQHGEWAESAHGDVNGAAWMDEDFKENTGCIRCHTATGYKNYITSGWKLATTTFATAGDKTYQVLTCDACHSNYNFKNSVRAAKQYVAPYNSGKSPATFPDVGNSNICISCHSGRESGATVLAVTDTAISNTSFKNPHYLAAAATMYAKGGFTAFVDDPANTLSGTVGKDTSGVTREFKYTESLTTTEDGGQLGSTHRKFGTSAIIGDHGITSGDTNMTTSGPCIVCHLNKGGANGAAHTLKIDIYAGDQVCKKCHAAEITTDGTTATNTDATKLATFLEEQHAILGEAIGLASKILKDTYKITFNPDAYPYFYDDQLGLDASGKPQAVKDWTRSKVLSTALSAKDAKRLMGACFNIQLLTKDEASYAHARTYSRRLAYDTIDFLDNNAMDRSVSVTATTLQPTIFVKGTSADTATGTTDAMLFLLGYDRKAKTWNSPERP